jgi:hypothetical protein
MNNDKDLLIQLNKILECYDFYDKEIKTHEQVDKILDVLFKEKDTTIEDIEIDLINF